MDQEQMQQTEQIISEMLEFLESSSDDEYELEQERKYKNKGAIKKVIRKNIVTENITNNIKTKKKFKRPRRKNLCKSIEIVPEIDLETKMTTNDQIEQEAAVLPTVENLDWKSKLENYCRHSYDNTFVQEVYKAIYQSSAGHPRHGSVDYYNAAQDYVLYGKHFLDFPSNIQVLQNGRTWQMPETEILSPIANFGSYFYAPFQKPSTFTPNISIPGHGVPLPAAYYQILNNMQAQTRTSLAANAGNSTAYGIFMGNKVSYVAGQPTTSSLFYNQHNTTTTNFISNSLANSALAPSPTILYTNPLLTTTTHQYLTQYLTAAALTSNSVQSTTVSANGGGGSVYERFIYGQMLQHQLYQTQPNAGMPAMFQNKHSVVNPMLRQSANVINGHSNRSSPQHIFGPSLPGSTNGVSFNTCYRLGRSASPGQLTELKLQPFNRVAPTETSENSKITTI